MHISLYNNVQKYNFTKHNSASSFSLSVNATANLKKTKKQTNKQLIVTPVKAVWIRQFVSANNKFWPLKYFFFFGLYGFIDSTAEEGDRKRGEREG